MSEADQGPTVADQTGGNPAAEINLADPNRPITRDDLIATLQARSNEKPPEYVPPPPTERQLEQTNLEMEAGRRRVAMNEAQKSARPAAVPSSVERQQAGQVTPVKRPEDGAGSEDRDKTKAFQPGGPKNK